MTPQIIGSNIRRRRRKLKLPAKTLAEMAEISRSYLYDVESGRVHASLKVLLRLCEALQCSLDELVSVERAEATPNSLAS